MSLNTDKMTAHAIFGILGLRWQSVACAKIKKLQFADLTIDKKLSAKDLIEEVKPRVVEKLEIE